MTVYVVEYGEYEDQGVCAVFASREKAIAAYPRRRTKRYQSELDDWLLGDDDSAWNGLDFDDRITITPYEVI